MATYRKRGSSWHVQIRRRGIPCITRTFINKEDAERWAHKIEGKIYSGELDQQTIQYEALTISELAVRYRDSISTGKRGYSSERYRIEAIANHWIGECTVGRVTSSLICDYRDERLQTVSPSTVIRELGLIRHLFNVAINEWGVSIKSNPVHGITMPKGAPPRERRLEPRELEKLINGCSSMRSPLLAQIITFAVETGLRRGEIIAARWSHLNLENSTLHIPISKTGNGRTIPLSKRAMNIIAAAEKSDPRIFPTTGNAVRLAWERLNKRTGIADLHFHDLRHEAISRFFEMGLSVPEVALISGHRDPRMLFRYTHLRAEDIVNKLG